MEHLLATLQQYWLEFTSAVVLGLAAAFHKWIIRQIKNLWAYIRSICPGRGLYERLDEISAELSHNHGSSIKDVVGRIEYKVTGISTRMNVVMAGLDIVSDTLNICRWAADSEGKINFVNQPLRELVGITDDNAWALGDAWTNTVYKEDREDAILEWNRCIKSKIAYHDTYRVVHVGTGKIIEVESHAKIIKDSEGKVEGWVGVVIPYENNE